MAAAATPGLVTDLTTLTTATGSGGGSTLGKAAAGAATGAAIGSAVPLFGTAVGAAVGAIAGALTGIFGGSTYAGGQGDINDGHFENGNLANLALQGNDVALRALAGRTNRYGYVHVPNKMSLHADVATPAQPLLIGTDEKHGFYPDVVWGRSAVQAHDEAWDLFQKVMAARAIPVPPPLSLTGLDKDTNLQTPFELSTAANPLKLALNGFGLSGTIAGIPIWVLVLVLLIGIAIAIKSKG